MSTDQGSAPTPAGAAGAAVPTRPAVSISLVTWNGLRWLPGCLASVAAQTLGDVELLVVDNGSTDGSAAWLAEHLSPDARAAYTAWPANRGYAAGHNHNLARARGRVLLLLNQDVELDPGFLAAASAVLDADPTVAAVQGRVRRLGPDGSRLELLDTTGLVMGRDRRVISRDQGRHDAATDAAAAATAAITVPATTPGPVWGVDGPVPVLRMAALAEARLPRLPRSPGEGTEILDESFFAHKEDVDLAWRLRRLGWRAWYEPAALAWHARGDSGSATGRWQDIAQARKAVPPSVRARSWRNHRLMLIKNDEPRALVRDLPWVVWHELRSLGYAVVADRALLRAMPDLLRSAPDAFRKRRILARRAASLHARDAWRRGPSTDPASADASARVPDQ